MKEAVKRHWWKFMEIFSEGVTNRQFLFLFHYGASEIYTSDYTTRSTAATCLRELVRAYFHPLDSLILLVRLTMSILGDWSRIRAKNLRVKGTVTHLYGGDGFFNCRWMICSQVSRALSWLSNPKSEASFLIAMHACLFAKRTSNSFGRNYR